MPDLKKLIALLKRAYGAPKLPLAKGPFELVMWENACYLLPDDRHQQALAARPLESLSATRGTTGL